MRSKTIDSRRGAPFFGPARHRQRPLVAATLAGQTRRPFPAGPRLSVIVPAYRETQIGDTVVRLRHELSAIDADGGVEIIVVDDGSGDDTAARAEGAGADLILRCLVNRGKGAAVRVGMLAARGAVVAFTDADLSYSPDQIVRLLHRVEDGWDVVIGSRGHDDAETLVATSALRRWGHRVINLSTRAVLVARHADTQCGIKAFRGDVARVLFSRARVDRFAFDIEVIHLVERYGLSMTDEPVQVTNSEQSTVHAGRDAARLLRDLLRIRWWSRVGIYDLPCPVDALLESTAPDVSPVSQFDVVMAV